MYLSSLLPLFAVLIASPSARAISQTTFRVKEQHPLPQGWTRTGPANADVIKLHVGLRPRVGEAIVGHLEQISDPRHHRYGQHLTADEVRKLVEPAEGTLEVVSDWLRGHGVQDEDFRLSVAKDWATITVPIGKAEEMLNTTYSTFTHEDGTALLRAPEWSLPEFLHEHIDVVQPTTSFTRPRRNAVMARERPPVETSPEAETAASVVTAAAKNPDLKGCKNNMNPRCIRALVGTLNYTVQSADKNSVAHANFLNETSHRKDIKQFLKEFWPEATAVADTFPIRVIAGADNDQGPYTNAQLNARKNIEATMDSEIMISNTYPTPFEAIDVGGQSRDFHWPDGSVGWAEPYIDFLHYLLDRESPPNVITISYGEDEQDISKAYAKRVCSMFAQLGARGVSVIVSSGDFGVGSREGKCQSNDGTKKRKFLPHFPASCPWVTSTGATEDFEPEVAAYRFDSGGGFSDYFPAPAYQKATVDAYIAGLNGLHKKLYRQTGRGYPDVAAVGWGIAHTWAGNKGYGLGTSASAPVWGSVVALLNDALLAKGRPTLGFLNPWLYGQAFGALNDVTVGSSAGCRTKGFPAKVGWDAVTGLGSPNFDKLLKSALATGG